LIKNGLAQEELQLPEHLVLQNAEMGLKLEMKHVMLDRILAVFLIVQEYLLVIHVIQQLLMFVVLFVGTGGSFHPKHVMMDQPIIFFPFKFKIVFLHVKEVIQNGFVQEEI